MHPQLDGWSSCILLLPWWLYSACQAEHFNLVMLAAAKANKPQLQSWLEDLLVEALVEKEMEVHALCAEFLKYRAEMLAREMVSPNTVAQTMTQRGIRFFRARRKLREVGK